jgi:hypothetical protein
MIIQHHDRREKLEDDWLVTGGMGWLVLARAAQFVPSSPAYIVDRSSCKDQRVRLIAICDIGPVCRSPGVPYFNASAERGLTAKERVIQILQAFVSGVALPPVELVETPVDKHPFKLTDGVHRLYLSLAVGFTHIPAVEGFDVGDVSTRYLST